jgi:hypothetical protein
MLKKKYLKPSLEVVFILLIILVGLNIFQNKKQARIWDADEVAWIFAGYYFNLYFLQFEYFHPDWSDYEAFDHPPLAKYVVGGSLYLKGYTIDSLDPKRFWNSIPIDKYSKYFDLVIYEIPNPLVVIPFIRFIIFGFALLSLLLIYIFVRISYGALPALITTLLIAGNSTFNFFSAMIQADPILLFFFALFTLLCALYWKSQNDIYIVLAFTISSLAFLTKLNGILLVPVLLVIFVIRNKFSISKHNWKYLITGFIAFLLVNIILNPVYLNTGINAIWKMVEVRLSAFHVFQETFKGVALLSVCQRFIATVKTIFFKYSIFYYYIRVPVELIMFLVGIYYILRKKDLFLITIFVFLVIIPICILPYNIPRYFYWISPFICIVAGLSINLFKEIWVGRSWFKGKTNQ